GVDLELSCDLERVPDDLAQGLFGEAQVLLAIQCPDRTQNRVVGDQANPVRLKGVEDPDPLAPYCMVDELHHWFPVRTRHRIAALVQDLLELVESEGQLETGTQPAESLG